MTSLERKSKQNIQISLNPFVLFILASLVIHGLGLFGFIVSQRKQVTKTQKTESTPIDFIVTPPEESAVEPPPDTERRAANNSIAQGEVKPELPVATNKIPTSEPNPVTQPATPESPVAPTVSTPPKTESTTQPQSSPQTITTPPKTESNTQPQSLPQTITTSPKPPASPLVNNSPAQPAQVKPTPQLPSRSQPEAQPPLISKQPKTPLPENVTSSATQTTEETKPEPVKTKPLTRESSSTSLPIPKPTSLPEKKTPQQTANTQPKLPPKSKPIASQSETPPKETEAANTQPESSSIAANSTNSSPESQPTETTAIKTPPQPQTTDPQPSTEQNTPIGSGAASLLGGTQSRSLSEDGGDSFFNPQANASQQALNPSGVDAQQDLNLAPYFDEIRRRVRRNWQPSTPRDNRQTVLAFSIQPNGQITGLKVRQSSGSPKVDQESLNAVAQSAPFPPLPSGFPNPQLDVQFNFNIYIHQGELTPDLESWQRF